MTASFEMTVDLNVLEHLGINLYSNVAAVLTEVVANAWDADAENVDIRIDPQGRWLEIEDDGIGMSVDELNTKYLRVGYRRRDEDPQHGRLTGKNRPVMGRKGLGKLSLFSIADVIEVQSAKDGAAAGFQMSVQGIQEAIRVKESYHPTALDSSRLTVERGTQIVLREIKRQRLTTGVTALKKRLARRFSVIGEKHGFRISINGHPIGAGDRGDLAKAQFLWTFEGDDSNPVEAPHVLEREAIAGRLDSWDPDWQVRGWIGTAAKPKDLDSEEAGNLNGIVVFARGRLFHENVLDRLNDGRLYTKYVTGQIEADFLDTDDEPDIATSDRQRVQEDDPRYVALLEFLRQTLGEVEKRWNQWRKKHEIERAKDRHPALREWLESLAEGLRQSAETLIARLSSLPLDEESDRRLLYRHAVFAFERMRLRGSTEELAASALDVEGLYRVLADRDALEAALYRDIVKSRLEVIRAFQTIVGEDTKERILQQYLFDHLWLLDPAWERATGSESMETKLVGAKVIVEDPNENEKLNRVDIKYRTTAGKHIIVELKKARRKMKLIELQEQGQRYVDKLKEILMGMNEISPNIEVVFVIGQPVAEEEKNPERIKASMLAISPGSRIVYFETLIEGARKAYAEYLDQSRKLDHLEKLVAKL